MRPKNFQFRTKPMIFKSISSALKGRICDLKFAYSIKVYMKRKSQKEKNFELRKVAHFKKVFPVCFRAVYTHKNEPSLFTFIYGGRAF